MVTARERLRQLSIAQESAEETAQADRVDVQPRYGLPRGRGIITRPIKPSRAEGLEPERGTPWTDFGEMFLNDLGITSQRQRTAQTETLAAIHSANQTIVSAVEEQAANIQARGIGGFDTEVFKNARAQQAKAAELLDNPDPSIQQYGQAMMQSVASTYDQLNKDQSARLGEVREQLTTRMNGLVDLGRAESSGNDGIIAQLNEYGKRNGVGAKLPVLVKQAVAEYLGGSTFAQKEGETRGIFENVPGFNVNFDPSEEITVGNASALIAAVTQERRKTLAGSLASEMEVATRSGFRLLDKDGKLTAEEIPVADLEPDISRLLYNMPTAEPMRILPGVPDAELGRRTAEASLETSAAQADTFLKAGKNASGYAGWEKDFGKGMELVDDKMKQMDNELRKMRGLPPNKETPILKRPTND